MDIVLALSAVHAIRPAGATVYYGISLLRRETGAKAKRRLCLSLVVRRFRPVASYLASSTREVRCPSRFLAPRSRLRRRRTNGDSYVYMVGWGSRAEE